MAEPVRDNKEKDPVAAKKDKKDKKKEDDLSLEDKQLKDRIDALVARMVGDDQSDSELALAELTAIIKATTTTMTSVPKPFKFLKTYYKDIVDYMLNLFDSDHKKNVADFLSVQSMIFAEKNSRASLGYLLQGTRSGFKNWGHEYLSHLASDIGKEYDIRVANAEPFNELIELVDEIVPYFIENNAEHDAIDLLLIVDKLEDIKGYVTKANFSKVNMYLSASANYSADNDEMSKTLNILYDIALGLDEYTYAMRVAIRLDDHDKIKQLFDECPDDLIKKQLAFCSARQKIFIPDLGEEETKIISNSKLSEFYLELAKDLEVADPKKPEDIFKAHLEEKGKSSDISAATTALFNTYVNAFVNAGLKRDTLIIEDPNVEAEERKQPWIFEVKDEGQIAAVASLGMLNLWYTDSINDQIMPYYDNEGQYVKAGSFLGIGLSSSGIYDENDIAFALLEEQVSSEDSPPIQKVCAILGLGIAFAGKAREDISELLQKVLLSDTLPVEQSAFAALSLGLVYVGKCDDGIANAIIQTLWERKEEHLNSHWAKLFGVGLGLLFMGQQAKCEAVVETLGTIEHPIKKYFEIIVESMAYTGSGNVLKVQKMANEFASETKHSQMGILGLAFIASSEEVGNEMAMRLVLHALHFATPENKRIIPLAIAVLHLSNPKIQVMDILQKLAYDSDSDLACKAILAMGLIGAGTNHARLADIFRKLAGYYYKDTNLVLCIRLAQGFLYMGKGMLTINPYYSEKFLFNKVSMAGILIFVTAMQDLKEYICGKYHFFTFYLALSMYPKMCFVLNDKLEPMPLNVRVGQAIDVVGHAGKPKKITGFQTHTSPVLVNQGERAELATEEYIPIQDTILENFVIVRRNPDYVEEEKPRKKTSM